MAPPPADHLVKVDDAWYVIAPGEAVHVTATPAPLGAEGRSPQWPALERRTVAEHPWCACCGAKQELQVHHVLPFSFPGGKERELDPDNLMVLCRTHHFLFGHLCNWQSMNPKVREDVAKWAEKIKNRPHRY